MRALRPERQASPAWQWGPPLPWYRQGFELMSVGQPKACAPSIIPPTTPASGGPYQMEQ